MKQHHLKILAKYAEKKEERTVLMKLSDDRDLFVEAVEKPQKTLAQTLEEFKSVKVKKGGAREG